MEVRTGERSTENGGEECIDELDGDVAVVSGADASVSKSDSDVHAMKTSCSCIPGLASSDTRNFATDVRRITVSQLNKPPKMPWQLGPMSLVFGGKMSFEPNFDQCFVGMSDFAKGNPANVADVVHPAWVSKYAGKRRRIVNAAVSADDLRCRSLLILKLILESNPVATMLGQQLDSLRENKQFEKIWQVLEDACSDKSTGTLYKRTRALWSYFGWLRDTGRSKLFVLDEELAYDYMVYARAKGKAATHGQSVLESFGFLHGIGHLVVEVSQVFSARVKGVVMQMYKQKRSLHQARPLKVAEVAKLEQIVLGTEPDAIRIIAGYLLFNALACCRFSDAMFAAEWTLTSSGQVALLETGSRFHKTARGQDRVAVLMPDVAIGRVFQEKCWAAEWLRLHKVHLDAKFAFTLPSFSEQTQQWLSRPMLASEGTLWMRELCHDATYIPDTLTTHGLKSTLISWCAKHGSFSQEELRVLGHHCDPGARAPLCYGRDNVSALQVKILVIIKDISDQLYDPDLDRPGLVAKRLEIVLGDIHKSDETLVPNVPDNLGLEAVAESDSEVENAEEVDVAADVEATDAGISMFLDSEQSAGRVMQHAASGVLHVIAGTSRFACGRNIGPRFLQLESGVNMEWPVCRQCRAVVGDEFFTAL